MSARKLRPSALPMHILVVVSALTAFAALVVGIRRAAATHPVVPESAPTAATPSFTDPIAAEAQVFRTRASVLAIAPTAGPRRSAHPRTMATYRSLRAYPGAPPRVPHGLSPSEFRTGGCNTCHERGGYSYRFDAYVPVTPHPEMGACLQCHVGDAKLMAIPLPNTDPSARCRQCHTSGGTTWTASTVNWKALPWPELPKTTQPGEPPPIPHALQMRGNCLACHSAPAAVEEIRTAHPERADCRSCHVAVNADTRPPQRGVRDAAEARDGVP